MADSVWGLGGTAGTPQQQALYQQIPQLSQQGAAAADPFAAQRAQYQDQLSAVMNGGLQGQNTSDIQRMREIAGQPMGGPYMDMLQRAMTDPSSITQTPGSQFAMKQGQQALERSKVAQGYLGSGNILSELQTQAQGEASKDYSQQLADMRAAAGLAGTQQNQAFTQASGIAGASDKNLQDQYSRLALLSGAQTGSPGAAGNILANQFDWSRQLLGSGGGGGGGAGAVASGAYGASSPSGVNERNDVLGSSGYNVNGIANYFGTRMPNNLFPRGLSSVTGLSPTTTKSAVASGSKPLSYI